MYNGFPISRSCYVSRMIADMECAFTNGIQYRHAMYTVCNKWFTSLLDWRQAGNRPTQGALSISLCSSWGHIIITLQCASSA